MGEPVGTADGDDKVADAHRVRVANGHVREVVALDLDQRDVGARIRTNEFGVEFAAVDERYDDFIGIANDVVIGQDIAIFGVNNDARAGAAAA